jgi:hypothetical protein
VVRFRRPLKAAAAVTSALATVVGFSAPADASARLNGCHLLSKALVASVNVDSKCASKGPSAFNFGGVHVGTGTEVYWGTANTAGMSMVVTTGAITVNIYNINPAYLALAKQRFSRTASGSKVGVGSWGVLTHYDTRGAGITFGIGNYIVQIAVVTPEKQPVASKLAMKQSVMAIATAVAKHL